MEHRISVVLFIDVELMLTSLSAQTRERGSSSLATSILLPLGLALTCQVSASTQGKSQVLWH